MGRIGGGELFVILLIALLLFGPSRLAEMGKGLGEGLRHFKRGLSSDDHRAAVRPAEAQPAAAQDASKPSVAPDSQT